MEYSYKITQEQKLRITNEMKISIKVLEMPIGELREYINEEFEKNPILEVEDNFVNEDVQVYKDEVGYVKGISDYEFKKYSGEENGHVSALNFVFKKKTLKEYLYEQVMEIDLSKEVTKIIYYLIENINNKGYLEVSKEEVLKKFKGKEKLIDESFNVLENLEPYGVGAQDLKQCLRIQVKHLHMNNEILLDIINNYLEDMAKNNFKAISKRWNITLKKAQSYGDIIKNLEPKPGRSFFTGEEVNYIVPDAEIKKINDEFVVIVNDRFLPKIKISSEYYDFEKDIYIKEKIKEASNLIRSIDNRKSTLTRVILEIAGFQQEYFEKGKQFLKPMNLKVMAEKLNLSQSTISRAIKDKYILTPNGTIKLRSLFTSTTYKVSENKDEVVVVEVKNRIKELIKGEDITRPMSDQSICDILNNNNINISRRTVAKYREEMGIKSSSKRKRM